MREEKNLSIGRFYGIDRSLDDTELPVEFASDACNFDTREGNLKVCKGFEKAYYNGIAEMRIQRIMPFFRREGQSFLLAYAKNQEGTQSKLYYAGMQRGGSWQELGLPSVGIGERIFSFVNYQREQDDIILLADGSWLKLWNGEAASPLEYVPVPQAPLGLRYIALGNERLWGAGVANEPDRVYYSKPFQPTDWQQDESEPDRNGGYIDLPTWESGGRIVGICEAFGDILVFKENDIFRIYGDTPSDFKTLRVFGAPGPMNHNCIVKHGGLVYYMSRQGLCVYDGNRAYLLDINEKAGTLWSMTQYDTQDRAFLWAWEDKLFISVPGEVLTGGGGSFFWEIMDNGMNVEYDPKRGTLMRRDGFYPLAMGSFSFAGVGNVRDILLFVTGDSYVYGFFDGALDYDGVPVKAYWETPWMDFKRKDITKTVTASYIFGGGDDGASIIVEAMSEKKKKRRVVATRVREGTVRCRIRVRGRRVKFRFANYLDPLELEYLGEQGEEICAAPIELKSGVQFLLDMEED
ncbi:MAG: hypothetical protein ACOYI4_00845 [Christensenellales bacterium]|jgi:hypothetical protein